MRKQIWASIKAEAESLAQSCFSRIGLKNITLLDRIPLETIINIITGWNPSEIDLKRQLIEDSIGGIVGTRVRAAWVQEGDQDKEDQKVYLNSEDSNAGKRFSLAHELGHFLMRLDQSIVYRISAIESMLPLNEIEERLADEFASCLLLPKDMLLAQFDESVPLRDGLYFFERMATIKGISLHMLAKRIYQVYLPGPKGWFFLTADRDVSKVKREGYSPRISSRVCPSGYYFATNRRLSSIGLSEVASKFESLRPFEELTLQGLILVESREIWKPVRLGYISTLKKYVTRGGYEFVAMFGRLQ